MPSSRSGSASLTLMNVGAKPCTSASVAKDGDDVVAVGTDELHLDSVAVRHRLELSGLDPQTVERRHVSGVESCIEILELGRHCEGRLGIGDLDQALAAVDVAQRAPRDAAQRSLDARVETVIVLHVGLGHWLRVGRHLTLLHSCGHTNDRSFNGAVFVAAVLFDGRH